MILSMLPRRIQFYLLVMQNIAATEQVLSRNRDVQTERNSRLYPQRSNRDHRTVMEKMTVPRRDRKEFGWAL
jgi:hypothetical protein